MSQLNTNLRGRLKNTHLPKKNGLYPLFEAVVNSMHSIEDAKIVQGGKITVEVLRRPQQLLITLPKAGEVGNNQTHSESTSSKSPISGFKVTDNGVGFNDENMDSFKTLDSEYKESRGARGVGRLLWLKAFRSVSVTSVYKASKRGNLKKRSFSFTATDGICNERVEKSCDSTPGQTTVLLDGFLEKYRDSSPKSGSVIATAILEHCLAYFVRDGGVPEIEVIDGEDVCRLDDLYEKFMIESASREDICIKDATFSIIHAKLQASFRGHSMALCANNRVVTEESLNTRIPGLYGKLWEGDKEFVYACFVSSEYLDDRVRSERTDFDISESWTPDMLFTNSEISLSDIRDAVLERAKQLLEDSLRVNIQRAKTRVDTFVTTRAPRYRPVLNRLEVDNLLINPEMSDKELELVLHKSLSQIEQELLAEGHDLMSPSMEHESYDGYRKKLTDYLEKAVDIKKSDLANYVSHRKVILDLLQKVSRVKQDGTYHREELIHTLIMPMRVESDDVRGEDCNFWLLDERLAFHDFLSSDKSIKSSPVTGSTSSTEPDMLGLQIFDNPMLISEQQRLPLASIVVVEVKRPMRNDARTPEKDPIEQALFYLDDVRKGKVKTKDGRPIPSDEQIPGFCYVVCDLTETVISRCRMHRAILSSDKLGYFFYHDEYKAYVEIISLDGLINRAEQRNRAFFDKLGLPTY